MFTDLVDLFKFLSQIIYINKTVRLAKIVKIMFIKTNQKSLDNMNDGLASLGVPIAFDPAEGITPGGGFLPSSMHPTNQSRSDARRTYYDEYIFRPNFHVATGQQVTRILSQPSANSTFIATGVEVRYISCQIPYSLSWK